MANPALGGLRAALNSPWLKPVRAALRGLRHASQGLRLRAALRRLAPPARGLALGYVTLGFPAPPPPRDQYAQGGAVKLTYLAEAFPHAFPACNIVYGVSSVGHPHLPLIAAQARRRGAKFVLNQNGVGYPAWYGPGWERLNQPMAAALRAADMVLYQSRFCQLAADRFLGRPPGAWEIVYNAVDVHHFVPAATPPPATPLVLLLGGTQSLRYRFEVAVRTLEKLIQSGMAAQLWVTGKLLWEPGALAWAKTWVAQLGLAERVVMAGTYTQATAPQLFQRAHLLLHPQYNDACPTLVLEAMACGLPVVYSASGGTPELVGENAGEGLPAELSWERILPPDPEQLARAVRQVAERHALYAEAARQRAVEHFSNEAWLARHKAIFETLAGACR